MFCGGICIWPFLVIFGPFLAPLSRGFGLFLALSGLPLACFGPPPAAPNGRSVHKLNLHSRILQSTAGVKLISTPVALHAHDMDPMTSTFALAAFSGHGFPTQRHIMHMR